MTADDDARIEPLSAALAGIADGSPIDWQALEAAATDDEMRLTFAALRAIERIAGAHRSLALGPERPLPFTWGPLHVRAHLARGGHGDVYRAWDPRLDREVALKLLRLPTDEDGASVAVPEGSLLARVRHPNVVTVYGADRIAAETGIWMELVEGRTLQERVQEEGPLPAAEVVAIGRAVCAGLAAVHAAGLVHRDIKAQNVMQDASGRTLLMDFGAGIEEHDPFAHAAGTPLYLAPELFEPGRRATCASDVYAVGVLLHLLLTGEYPVSGATFTELQAKHRRGARVVVERPAMPHRLSQTLARALQPAPSARFASAADMLSALDDAAVTPRRWRSHGFRWAAMLAVGVTVGVASLTWPARPVSPPVMAVGSTLALPPQTVGAPSTDGRFIPFTDVEGSAYRWDVRARTSTPIVRAEPTDGRAASVLLNDDGAAAIYAWDRVDGLQELRVAGIEASWSRVVLPPQRDYQSVPLDWSRDGAHVLATLQHRDGSSSVAVVPVSGGPPQVLLTLAPGASVSGGLAPDRSFAAVSINGTRDQGLTILPLSGAPPIVVLDGHTRFAQVVADRRVFFLRQDKGEETGWLLDLDRRLHPRGRPTRVTEPLGGTWQTRVTRRGVYLVRPRRSAEIYTVAMDEDLTVPLGPPSRIDPTEAGNHVSPSWSPDGRFLAFFTIAERTPGLTPSRRLTIRDMVTGVSRQLRIPLVFLGGYAPRWSPDGRWLAIWGRDGERDDAWGYFRVNVADGATSLLVRVGINAPARSQYGPDRTSFLYVDPTRGLVVRDLRTGAERVRVPRSSWCRPGGFALDHSGTRLAFTCVDERRRPATTSLLVRSGDAAAVLQAHSTAPAWVDVQGWTPDGAALVVMRGDGSQRPATLWKMPVAPVTGNPSRLEIPGSPTGLDISPVGGRLAYVERVQFPELTIQTLRSP